VKSYQDLKEKTLGMTGFFETSNGYPICYGITSGNHDDQGISHGVLQFNLGTGSLPPLWNYLNTNYNQMCMDIFGANYTEWANMLAMSTVNQVAWGESITDYARNADGYKIYVEWENLFQTLGETPQSIEKQITYAESWLPNAHKWFNTLGLYSRRGFALCWDISVQMGRLFSLNQIYQDFKEINPTGKTRAQIEEEKLRIICDRCSFDNRPSQYSQTVWDRKIMLINGTGDYFGSPFIMAQYDLNYDPAFKGGIFLG